ncbi:MAG: hypothetical protein ACD_7C00154G0009 [uncultured bacterium]|nr:MAG: hypothetical protein ACD_7C00154G0009 [uncultured bacterium]HBR79358.1 hypothetical protein [Candidatus Moranbacteria bacterium]
MNNIREKLNLFKEIVIKNCDNDNFKYREWFVRDHLIIVERIAMELCDIYTKADRNLVFALVWLHDFGKPLDAKNEYALTKTKGLETLQSVGLRDDFIGQVFELWEKMERKEEQNISQMDIEVQIISSADGASHFTGKFYATYFQDNSSESIASLENRIKEKIIKDWERKMVLPEVKKVFESRYLQALEIVGDYPEKFII